MQTDLRSARIALSVATALATLFLLAPGAAVAAPAPTVVKIVVVKGRPVGGVKRPTVKKGAVVRIIVTSDAGKELHLHGYDVEKAMRPGTPTVIRIVATIPGRFELEMHSPDSLLAQLTVRP
jgi:hypothetical protein